MSKRTRSDAAAGAQSTGEAAPAEKRPRYEVPTEPVEPKLPKTPAQYAEWKRVIVVLEQAPLETVKLNGKFSLLNCDDHRTFCKKHNLDPAIYRPDITHQVLLQLLDSPLNKAGRLQLFIHTAKGVLIEVNPRMRVPRTFPRFAGLMVQLLHKLSIRATNGPDKLMRVIKNPVTDHLPANARRFGTSVTAPGGPVHMRTWLEQHQDEAVRNGPVVWVIGAIAHGHIELPWVDEFKSFSHYPLSAAVAAGRLTNAYEDLYHIV